MSDQPYVFSYEDKTLFSKLRKEARDEIKTCIICNEPTAKNHVFPSAYLKKIILADHIKILTEDDLYKSAYISEGRYYFDLVGIAQEIKTTGCAMQVFCNKHDSQIFNLVDNMESEKLKYEHFLLCAYKSLLHEYSKNKNNLIFMRKAKLKTPEAYKYWGFEKGEDFHKNIMQNSLNQSGLMRGVLIGNEPQFHEFKPFIINKKIEFFMNGCFGMDFFPEKRNDFLVHSFFISCIPQGNKTTIVFGGHKSEIDEVFKHYFSQNNHLKGEKKILKLLSDIAIRNVETWGMSEAFYEGRIKHKESAILERIEQMFPLEYKKNPVGDICLFWD